MIEYMRTLVLIFTCFSFVWLLGLFVPEVSTFTTGSVLFTTVSFIIAVTSAIKERLEE